LRGSRGGLILCRKDHAKLIDAAVFPGLQGGPHMNNVAGTAVTLKKAAEPEFRTYAEQVLKNARVLAAVLVNAGASLVTGGTDNHMLVVDTIQSFGIDGRLAEETLDRVGITTNKQVIPDDPRPPLRPSGIRLGTPACTTRGMRETEMELLAGWMISALRDHEDPSRLAAIGAEVKACCAGFPVPGLV
jgi:glycine hydroxymethyltransferase